MRISAFAGVSVVAFFSAAAQTPLSFEVASVRPAPIQPIGHQSVRMSTDRARLLYTGVTLRNVLAAAYQVKDKQISGPDWLDSERFDIQAKLPAGALKEQIPAMLQTLLAERFALKLHHETKTMSVYALVMAKGGAKLREALNQEDNGMHTTSGPKGRILKGTFTMNNLADYLSNTLDRPVVDMTGLSKKYDAEMTWTAEEKSSATGDGADGPSIYAALQETMGLKLEARKLPVEMLIIDHVDKVPVEN